MASAIAAVQSVRSSPTAPKSRTSIIRLGNVGLRSLGIRNGGDRSATRDPLAGTARITAARLRRALGRVSFSAKLMTDPLGTDSPIQMGRLRGRLYHPNRALGVWFCVNVF